MAISSCQSLQLSVDTFFKLAVVKIRGLPLEFLSYTVFEHIVVDSHRFAIEKKNKSECLGAFLLPDLCNSVYKNRSAIKCNTVKLVPYYKSGL